MFLLLSGVVNSPACCRLHQARLRLHELRKGTFSVLAASLMPGSMALPFFFFPPWGLFSAHLLKGTDYCCLLFWLGRITFPRNPTVPSLSPPCGNHTHWFRGSQSTMILFVLEPYPGHTQGRVSIRNHSWQCLRGPCGMLGI